MRHQALILSVLCGAALATVSCGSTSAGNMRHAPGDGPGVVAAPVASSTFDHPAALTGGAAATVREALDRMAVEGPPLYTAHVHSCRKIPYGTVGRMLAAYGVDLDGSGETAAGHMWRTADQALGAPNYAARVPESTEITAASSGRLFDIFVQAAPEIIAALPTVEACQVGGTGARLFDADGSCREDGFTCLLGVPVTTTELGYCNALVARADDPAEGQQIAVAAILAAANTCE